MVGEVVGGPAGPPATCYHPNTSYIFSILREKGIGMEHVKIIGLIDKLRQHKVECVSTVSMSL